MKNNININSKAKVSILIVTFNAERFIKKTALSCINQTHENIEVLILDNNSSDGTIRIIESIRSEKIKLFKSSENLGPYAGLNFLLEKTNGDYVAVQDHDDIWFPDKIKKQVEFLEKNLDFIACGTDIYYYYEEKEELALKKFKKKPGYVNHTSLMFRNNGFRYETGKNFPDENFEKEILGKHGKIGCIQEGLTVHRIRSDAGNLSRKRAGFSFKKVIEILKRDGLTISSLKYIFYVMTKKLIPSSIVWFLRKKITMKNLKWITAEEFKKKFNLLI
jgi:glycosyltransferase involved in cell wall biosynthesis